MKIVVNNTEYTAIKDLKFSEQIDILCEELPINEFTAEIKTTDNIEVGNFARLYDNRGTLWANFWIISSDRYTDDTITIYCQSIITVLDRLTVPSYIYDNADFTTTTTALFQLFNITVSIDTAFQGVVITGYAPEQTVRERLQWICFSSGAYIQSTFTNQIQIKSINSGIQGYITPQKIYQFPSVSYEDYVSVISITYYEYTQNIPTIDQDYVKIWDTTDEYYRMYVQTQQTIILINPNVPQTVKPNVLEIKDIYLINSANVNDVINRLAAYHFNRVTLKMDIVNNGEYLSGNKYILALPNSSDVAIGIISSNDWSFGFNHKSSAELKHGTISQAVQLNLNAIWTDEQALLRSWVYYLPSGYAYSINNPILDITTNGERDIYRPINTQATGTMGTSETTDNEEYIKALTYERRKLYIYSVDNVAFDTENQGAVIDGE